MNEAPSEALNEAPINVEKDAEVVSEVLREYAAKLANYNADLLVLLKGNSPPGGVWNYSQLAWLLDRFVMINRPLQRVLSRGSGLVENGRVASRTRDILELRMRELESHLHHAERQTQQLTALLGESKHAQEVAKLRYAAGLHVNQHLKAVRV